MTSQPIGDATKSIEPRSVAGGCGLYGWATGATRELLFYADAETARYDSVSGPVNLTAVTPFPAVNYQDPKGKLVELRLGQGETMAGGTRFPNARISTQTDEGWERITPIAVVQNC